jgi:hypothetical protein
MLDPATGLLVGHHAPCNGRMRRSRLPDLAAVCRTAAACVSIRTKMRPRRPRPRSS